MRKRGGRLREGGSESTSLSPEQVQGISKGRKYYLGEEKMKKGLWTGCEGPLVADDDLKHGRLRQEGPVYAGDKTRSHLS